MHLPRVLFMLLCTTVLGLYFACLAAAADGGAKTFSKSCSPCHSSNIRPLDNRHQTREQWKESIVRMFDWGVEVPKEKMSELLDYLSLTHGPTGTAAGSGKK